MNNQKRKLACVLAAAGFASIGPANAQAQKQQTQDVGQSHWAEPVGDPAQWVTVNDYPSDALRKGEEGTTAFRLQIDATGRPTSCGVTVSSGSIALDQTTCYLMVARGTFTPARNLRGESAPGIYSNRVRWKIPEQPVPRPVPKAGSLTMRYEIAPDGSVSHCSAEQTFSPNGPLATREAERVAANLCAARFSGFPAGTPVGTKALRVTTRQTVTVEPVP